MTTRLGLVAVLFFVPFAQAQDIGAGKARATEVCAACHGAEGVSVSDTIPNLAGQRARYLEEQLKALKSGARKNGIMNPIASQLGGSDIANVAAYFGSLSGAASGSRSDFMPSIAKTQATFPGDPKSTLTRYHAVNFPELQQVKVFYANAVALRAAKFGNALPDGSVVLQEVYTVKRDAQLALAKGPDGIFIPNQLVHYTVMARGERWGRDIPVILRNEDWNYAVFLPNGQPRPGINLAECLACHKSQNDVSFLFTIKELGDVAKTK